jgi:hypothetical protein
MYGSNLDFSSVTLPGVGGSLNAATAISSDRLQEMNKTGKKWRTDEDGNLTFHNEALLDANKKAREKRANLVNRDRNENADGQDAMKEIMSRKKARAAAFREIKRQEYNFADDTELMSMPQPFFGEGCSASCKGPGKCSCASCKAKAKEERDFREWSTEKRKKLQTGEVKGEFAGPGMSFPISSAEDVSAAWSSVGRAPNPRKVMAEIIRIAKKYSWEEGLPQTVRDRLEKGESGLPSPDFREWPAAKRKALKEGEMKGEFAGPGTSFPIAGPKDVAAAWASVGRATDPKSVMKNIIDIAKKHGWESGLPETVKQRLKAGGTGLPE